MSDRQTERASAENAAEKTTFGARLRLRQGRRVLRTIYLQRGEEPSDDDQIIGLVDTEWLAARIVAAVNGEPTPALREELWAAYRAGQVAALRDKAIGANPYGVDRHG